MAQRPVPAPIATRRALAFAALALALAPVLRAGAQEAAAAMYVRGDNNATSVYTPRVRLGLPLGAETDVDVVYTVDVWTSASVDIVASASKAVTEQRDEIDVALAHEFEDVGRLTASYRFSTEPDYLSHGGGLGFEYDLGNKNAILGASVFASFDQVGRAGDPDFQRDAQNVSGKLSFSQNLDPDTLVQGIYELRYAGGYLSSPYRFIGIGGDDWTCRGANVLYCVPETNPDERLGHALALRGARALGDHFSVHAGYRFYIDDWAMRSHTIEVRGSWLPEPRTQLGLRYRFYTQGAADQWFPRYEAPQESGYYTGDRELSSLNSQQIGLDVQHSFSVGQAGETLRTMLALGPTFYTYRDYLLLDSVTAWEATVALVLEL